MPRSISTILSRIFVAAYFAIALPCTPATAASLSSRDVQIIAKVLGFLDPARRVGVLAVVYASHDTESKNDADAIVTLFANCASCGDGSIRAAAVDAASLADGIGYIGVILAAGPQNTGASLGRLHGLLTITSADSLVRSANCIMEVHSQPVVAITVSHAAAAAAGITFTAAFRMLVNEI